MNKKAQTNDLAGFFIMFLLGLVFFFLFGFALIFGGLGDTSKYTADSISEMKKADSAVNNLRIQIYEGNNLEEQNINQLISNSKDLRGKTITTCTDYVLKNDCTNDPMNIGSGFCSWLGNVCHYDDPAVMT
jgi:hypothetical protein